MINNQVQLAKQKLREHKRLGNKSPFSVFEIAKMMDRINELQKMTYPQVSSIYFNHIFYN